MAAVLTPDHHRHHGAAIRTLRLEARLTVDEAAGVLGMDPLELEQFETGLRRYESRAEWWEAMMALWNARRCAVDGCCDNVHSREKCAGHYKQSKRTGAVRPKRRYSKAGE